jgi:hypothetical protein
MPPEPDYGRQLAPADELADGRALGAAGKELQVSHRFQVDVAAAFFDELTLKSLLGHI